MNINNNDILQFNYNALPKYSIRNNLKSSLENYYLINRQTTCSKKIYIGQINNTSYNLSDILRKHDCNILSNLSFINDKPFHDNSTHIITFSIMCNNIKLISFSNKSLEIHDLNILDYFESRFIDINNFGDDIILLIEFAMFNAFSKLPLNIGIYCNAINITDRYKLKKKISEYSILEHIRFYNLINHVIDNDCKLGVYETYKSKLLSENTCLYNLINENTTQLNIYRKEAICPIIYFSFLWNDNYTIEFPKIKNITIIIDQRYIIEFNSSRINCNNQSNLHFIEFYPDNNNDLLKSNGVLGLNLNTVNELKVHFTFQDNYALNTKICVGFMLFKMICYK